MQGRGQAEVEQGEGGRATRQGSDPLSCLLAAPRTNPPQVHHPQVLRPQQLQAPMCFGEAGGRGEHPPLWEAWASPPPSWCAPATVHGGHLGGGKCSPCGGRLCARGWSLKPRLSGEPVGLGAGRWGPVPLTNAGLTEAETSDLHPPACDNPSLTSEADSSAGGPRAAVGLWRLPAAVSVPGRAWGRAEARPAGFPGPVLVALPTAFHAGAGVLAEAKLQGPCAPWMAQSCQAGLAPD